MKKSSTGNMLDTLGQLPVNPLPQKLASTLPLRLLESLDTRSTNAFWQSVKSCKVPYIEMQTNAMARVTYLFEGNENTQGVHLLPNYNNFHDQAENQFVHIPETTIWYLTHEIDPKTICFYHFNVTSKNDQPAESTSEVIVDPLNSASVLLLPQAVQDPYLLDVPTSEKYVADIEHSNRCKLYFSHNTPALEMNSALKSLTNENIEFLAAVITPKNYDENKVYPVLFCFDGTISARDVHIPYTLDKLAENQQFPEVIAVYMHVGIVEDAAFLEAPDKPMRCGQLRLKMLSGQPEFTKYIAESVLPFVRANYSVSKNSEDTYVYGQSLGGVASFYCAIEYPKLFGNVLCHSGSFWDHPIAGKSQGCLEKLKGLEQDSTEPQRKKVNFIFTANEFEANPARKPVDLVDANKNLANYMKSQGYKIEFIQHPASGHEYAAWRVQFPKDLKALQDVKLNNKFEVHPSQALGMSK